MLQSCAAVQEFYMLSQRQKQHATPSEIEAVRLACKRLVFVSWGF
jgi:hypothetical protein